MHARGLVRGQVALDYLLALAAIIAIIAAIAVPALSDYELSSALAAARLGAQSYAATNGSLLFTSVDYSLSSSNATFRPRTYLRGVLQSGDARLRDSILSSISAAVAPGSPVNSSSVCVPSATRVYCVEV